MIIPQGRYALLSREPLLRKPAISLLAGLRPPQGGRVRHVGRCSWPIGRPGFIRGELTGLQIIGLIARLYDLPEKSCVAFMREILTDPESLRTRMSHAPMRDRAEFGYSLALLPQFDLYVFDGVFPSFVDRFTSLWLRLFSQRIEGRTLILSTTRAMEARHHCTSALILDAGHIRIDSQLDQALYDFPPRPAVGDVGRNQAGNIAGELP